MTTEASTLTRDQRSSATTEQAAAAERVLMWVCVLIGLLQVGLVFYPDPILIIWPDSFNLMLPAVHFLEGAGFTYHNTSGGFLYPLTLLPLFAVSIDPVAIIVAQSAMVIATYCCLAISALFLVRSARRACVMPVRLAAPLVVAWLMSFVLYPGVIGQAHTLMPETLFGLLVSVLLLSTTVALTAGPGRPSRVAASLIGMLNVAIVLVKSHWLVASIVCSVALPFVMPRGQRREVLVRLAIGLVLGLVVLAVPDGIWERQDAGQFKRVFAARSLFCNSADLIYDHLATHGEREFSETLRRSLGPILTPEARQAASGWVRLGFDGDRCSHGETGKIVASRFAGHPEEEAAFYYSTYLSAVLERPSYLASRLWYQLSRIDPFIETDGSYGANTQLLVQTPHVSSRFAIWRSRYEARFVGEVTLPTMHQRRVDQWLALAGSTVLKAGVLAGVILLLPRRRRPALAAHERCFVVAALCALSVNVLTAIVHMADGRYLVMQTPLFVFLGLTGTLTVLARMMSWVRPQNAAT